MEQRFWQLLKKSAGKNRHPNLHPKPDPGSGGKCLLLLLDCTSPPQKHPVPEPVGTCALQDPGPFLAPWEPPKLGAGPTCDNGSLSLQTPFNILGANIVAGTSTPQMLSDLDTLIARLPELNGPWGKPVVGPHRSEDGIHFEENQRIVLDCASVPDVVEGPDGRLWMMFVDTDVDLLRRRAQAHQALASGFAGIAGLGLAVSEDGTLFERVSVEISGDVPLYVVDPDIVPREDGSYDLYFFGVTPENVCEDAVDPSRTPGPHQVYRATSDDLQHWTLQGVVWSPDGGTDPAAWCRGDDCYLWMGTAAHSSDGGKTYVATDLGSDFVGNRPDVFWEETGFLGYGFNGSGWEAMRSEQGDQWSNLGPIDVMMQGGTGVFVEGEVWVY